MVSEDTPVVAQRPRGPCLFSARKTPEWYYCSCHPGRGIMSEESKEQAQGHTAKADSGALAPDRWATCHNPAPPLCSDAGLQRACRFTRISLLLADPK